MLHNYMFISNHILWYNVYKNTSYMEDIMDWIQFFTIMATLLGGFGFIYKEIREDVRAYREDIKTQSARSDQLYTMFIDLLKSKKN